MYYMCLVACYSDSDPFVRSKLDNRRFGFVSVLDSMHSGDLKTDLWDDP